MKKFKESLKNIVIILTIIFIALPLLYELYKLLFTREGYANCDYESTDVKLMDRVDLSGIDLSYNDGTSYSGVSGDFLYCPAGTIKCSNDIDASLAMWDASYTISGEDIGNTYYFDCSAGRATSTSNDAWSKTDPHAICDNHFSNIEDDNYNYYFTDMCFNYTKWYKGPHYVSTNNEFDISDVSLNGGSAALKGFLGPYNYVPMSLSGDTHNEALKIYNSEESLYFSSTPCFLYDERGNCTKDCYNTDCSDSEECSKKDCSDCDDPSIKCIAHYGTDINDKVCCGEDGYVKDTKYICPAEYPYCKGYECGETWGKCHSSTS